MISSKVCFKCSKKKPLFDFYKHPGMADGHLGKCKECAKSDTIRNRKENMDYYRQYDLDRAKDPHRKAMAYEVTKAWREADARRNKCHQAVKRAILSGAIKKMSCVVCGGSKSMAHHDDYDKPLDVTWYCQPCHVDHHKGKVIGK